MAGYKATYKDFQNFFLLCDNTLSNPRQKGQDTSVRDNQDEAIKALLVRNSELISYIDANEVDIPTEAPLQAADLRERCTTLRDQLSPRAPTPRLS